MFIHFEILSKGHEANISEVMVSKPEDACNLMAIIETSTDVVAYKMLSHKSKNFGWDSQGRNKLRENNLFTEEDWNIARGDIN